NDHDRGRPPHGEAEAFRRRDRRRALGERVPLWHVPAHPAGRGAREREDRLSGSRRAFLRTGAAGGAALLIRVPAIASSPKAAARFVPNPWIRIGRDGRVTLVVARSEMGQGVRTALAMILADELEADWKSIAIEQ